MKIHPYAQLYPKMPERDFEALVVSIRAHSLRNAIVVDEDGRVIDGRHRHAACEQAGAKIRTETFRGDDAAIFQFIKDCNYHRRHLTVPQRARIANAAAQLPKGVRPDASPDASTQAGAAKEYGVGRATVQRARQIEDHGIEELKRAAFDEATMSLEDGAKIAKESPEVQVRVVGAVKPRMELKNVRRERRERELAEATVAASEKLGVRQYGVILADPPWRFEPYSRETGLDPERRWSE